MGNAVFHSIITFFCIPLRRWMTSSSSFLVLYAETKENFIVKGEYKKDGTKFKVSWQTYLKGWGHGDYCYEPVKIAK